MAQGHLLASLFISVVVVTSPTVSTAQRSSSSVHDTANDAYTLRGNGHLIHGYTARTNEGHVRVVVEIPSGTNAKWEVDKQDGQLKWEFKNGQPRIVRYLAYPANYGMIPRTILPKAQAGDGDPLDVLVLGPAVARGAVVEAKLIGVLKLLDGGEQDDKLIAVMPGTVLGNVNSLVEMRQQFNGILEIVETWFTNYKGPGELVSKGIGDAEEANAILDAAVTSFEGTSLYPRTDDRPARLRFRR